MRQRGAMSSLRNLASPRDELAEKVPRFGRGSRKYWGLAASKNAIFGPPDRGCMCQGKGCLALMRMEPDILPQHPTLVGCSSPPFDGPKKATRIEWPFLR